MKFNPANVSRCSPGSQIGVGHVQKMKQHKGLKFTVLKMATQVDKAIKEIHGMLPFTRQGIQDKSNDIRLQLY